MQYDFDAHIPANHQPAREIIPAATSGNYGNSVERTVLFGTDIRNSKVPHIGSSCKVSFKGRNGHTFGLNEDLLSKHLLLLGGIGCGKTNVFNFIIESLEKNMSADDILLIFDTKGDFKRRFYRPQDCSYVLIGNDSQYRNISKSWNIFDELKDSNGLFSKGSELTAKEIAKQLFKGRESSTQPFFSLAAADLVAKAMIHLMRKATKNHTESGLNTDVLVHFLTSANQETYYNMTADPDNKDFVSAQLYFGKPGEKMTAQALGIFGYINSMVNDLFVGVFSERRPAGNFSMRKLVREKGRKVVFIEYDMSVGETLGPMYRLMFDLALKEALGGREKNRGNTYLIIDEFKLLPDLMHIDDALNFGRSLGVKVCAGLQSINQLYDIYGTERGKVLASGFMNSFCFQTWDLDSRKFISDRFGETYENLAFRSQTTPVTVQRAGHVVEDWNILNLGVGQAYVNLFGHPPFLFQFENFDIPHSIL